MYSLPDNRKIKVNGTKEPIEFKSNQWFGAAVKAHRGKVVVSMNRGLWGGSGMKCTWKCFKNHIYKNPFMQEHVRLLVKSLSTF